MLSDTINSVLQQLSPDGTIRLKRLTQDGKSFGNALLVISVQPLDVKFVLDRGNVWCEILVPGEPGEWYFFEDVMTTLHLPFSNSNTDLVDAVTATVRHLQQHWNSIMEALQPERVRLTKQEVQRVVNERVSQRYGLPPVD